MINIAGVTKKFGNFTAVDNISLEIPDGEFLGLLGPNGAGKTTLISMLTGLLKPSDGEIYINSKKVTRDNKEVKKKIGVVPQYTNLDKELTVYENLVFAGKLFKIPKSIYERKIEELLNFIELGEFKDRKSMHLSGGMQRRLMIAKALMNEPDIIFLDEPTVGVDLNGRRKIWDILKAMKTLGKTVLLTTHYIEEAEYLCSKVCLINEGKIFKNDTPDNLKIQLGSHTVEYFDDELKTNYKFFHSRDDAVEFSSGIKDFSYTIRETTLEDVFYNFTNRKVV